MAKTNKEALIEEKQEQINAEINALSRGDYRASKLVAEVCAVVKAALSADMPVYDGYLAALQEAQERRDRINQLEEEIEDLKK